jgi:hypothetical protein
LHDEEMGVVDIELYGIKEVLNLSCGCVSSINEVFAPASNEHLSSDGDLGTLFVSNGARGRILVVEDNRDTGLVDPRLSLFVDEFGQISSPHLTQVGNAQHETNRIQNIGLSGPIQTRNRIEMRIKPILYQHTT